MSWHVCAALCFLGLALLCGLAIYVEATRERKDIIRYRDINKHRITPRFNVGRDVK